MTQHEIDILNFENDLTQMRKKLNNLIYESNQSNNELYQDKIYYLETEIKYMTNQLDLLKKGKMSINSIQQPIQRQQIVLNQNKQINPNYQQPIQNQNQKQQNMFQPNMYQQIPPKPNINIEQFLGKNITGILASIFIFISLILFATLMLP